MTDGLSGWERMSAAQRAEIDRLQLALDAKEQQAEIGSLRRQVKILRAALLTAAVRMDGTPADHWRARPGDGPAHQYPDDLQTFVVSQIKEAAGE